MGSLHNLRVTRSIILCHKYNPILTGIIPNKQSTPTIFQPRIILRNKCFLIVVQFCIKRVLAGKVGRSLGRNGQVCYIQQHIVVFQV